MIGLTQDTDARVVDGVFLPDRRHLVGQIVVDDNEFKITESLMANAFNGLGEVFLPVEHAMTTLAKSGEVGSSQFIPSTACDCRST